MEKEKPPKDLAKLPNVVDLTGLPPAERYAQICRIGKKPLLSQQKAPKQTGIEKS